MVVSKLSHCAFLRTLAYDYEVVCALSALEANDPYEKPAVCRSQLTEMLLAEGPR